MKIFKTTNNKLVLRLEKGEEILSSIEKAAKGTLTAGYFTGIGAISPVTIGYFNFEEYVTKTFDSEPSYEVLSLMGNIVTIKNEPMVHGHIQVAGPDYKVFGGHLIEGIVTVTMEIIIEPLDINLTRKKDVEFGLNLLSTT